MDTNYKVQQSHAFWRISNQG